MKFSDMSEEQLAKTLSAIFISLTMLFCVCVASFRVFKRKKYTDISKAREPNSLSKDAVGGLPWYRFGAGGAGASSSSSSSHKGHGGVGSRVAIPSSEKSSKWEWAEAGFSGRKVSEPEAGLLPSATASASAKKKKKKKRRGNGKKRGNKGSSSPEEESNYGISPV